MNKEGVDLLRNGFMYSVPGYSIEKKNLKVHVLSSRVFFLPTLIESDFKIVSYNTKSDVVGVYCDGKDLCDDCFYRLSCGYSE